MSSSLVGSSSSGSGGVEKGRATNISISTLAPPCACYYRGSEHLLPPFLSHSPLPLPPPLPYQETRAFVLKLWKFLHIRVLQREHNIPDSSVEVLTPLPLDQLSGGEPSIVGRIKVILIAVLQRGLNRSDFNRLKKEASLSVLVFTEGKVGGGGEWGTVLVWKKLIIIAHRVFRSYKIKGKKSLLLMNTYSDQNTGRQLVTFRSISLTQRCFLFLPCHVSTFENSFNASVWLIVWEPVNCIHCIYQ